MNGWFPSRLPKWILAIGEAVGKFCRLQVGGDYRHLPKGGKTPKRLVGYREKSGSSIAHATTPPPANARRLQTNVGGLPSSHQAQTRAQTGHVSEECPESRISKRHRAGKGGCCKHQRSKKRKKIAVLQRASMAALILMFVPNLVPGKWTLTGNPLANPLTADATSAPNAGGPHSQRTSTTSGANCS